MEVSDTEVLDTEVSDTDVSEGYAGCQEARGRVGFARGFNIRCVFYKKSSVKPSESCIEAVSSAFVRKGIQKAPLFLASKIGTKRSVSVESAFTRTLTDPTRTQTQTPRHRQIRDTEETKRSVSVESAFTRTLIDPTRTPGQRQIRDAEETKRSVSVASAFTRTLIGPTRAQTQTPGQRQIRDTEETKRSVSVESPFTRTLVNRPHP